MFKNVKVLFPCLIVLILLLLLVDIQAGYASIPWNELLSSLFAHGDETTRFLIVELRLPRVLASLLIGIGLSLSGCVLQGVSHNEMAEPGLLGINAGAGLMMALYLLLFQNQSPHFSFLLPLLAFAGAGLTFWIEYKLASNKKKLHPKRLLLMGVAISMAITSLTTILMLKMPDQQYAFVQSWIAGNIWGASWTSVLFLTVSMAVIFGLIAYKSRILNALALQEEVSIGIGVNVFKESRLFFVLAIILASLCASIGGGLSFVGLVCPHLARRIVGSNYKKLVPACVLIGGVLLLVADIGSRTLFLPYEMPIGIVATVIGAPYFLYLLMKN